MSIVADTLAGRIGSRPILAVKDPVAIDTMKFDGHVTLQFEVICEQALNGN